MSLQNSKRPRVHSSEDAKPGKTSNNKNNRTHRYFILNESWEHFETKDVESVDVKRVTVSDNVVFWNSESSSEIQENLAWRSQLVYLFIQNLTYKSGALSFIDFIVSYLVQPWHSMHQVFIDQTSARDSRWWYISSLNMKTSGILQMFLCGLKELHNVNEFLTLLSSRR